MCIIFGLGFILGDLPTRLVLCIIFLQLSRAQQRMDLAVSKYPDLLIREGALHAIWIVSQVLLFIVVILIFGRRLSCRRNQWFVLAWEVGCLEGLQVFLKRILILVRLLMRLEGADGTYQGDTWDLHR